LKAVERKIQFILSITKLNSIEMTTRSLVSMFVKEVSKRESIPSWETLVASNAYIRPVGMPREPFSSTKAVPDMQHLTHHGKRILDAY
jgi:hypothetical protein